MELDMRIKNDFIKKQINKLINKMIYKKINSEVDTQIDNVEITTLADGRIEIVFNGAIVLSKSFIPKFLEMLIV